MSDTCQKNVRVNIKLDLHSDGQKNIKKELEKIVKASASNNALRHKLSALIPKPA